MPYRGNEDVFKYNYVEKITKLLPEVYISEEKGETKVEEIAYKLLGKYLLAANECDTFFTVSGYALSSIKPFFVPENRLTRVDANTFTDAILAPLNKSFNSFKNQDDFKNYFSGTIQPNMVLSHLSDTFVSGVSSNPNNDYTVSAQVHSGLVDTVGLLYMLNTSSNANATTELSAVLADYVTSAYYSNGGEFTEETAANVLFEYIWKNRDAVPEFGRYLPPEFDKPTSSISGVTFASGIQQLERLQTLLSVWLNKEDQDSPFIRNSLEALEGSSLIYSKFDSSGPFTKFMKAASWAFYDLDMIVESMQDLFDIENCPPQFLDHLASVIGWRFLGDDVSMWRGQLRRAVYTYKAKGTRQALVDAIKIVFPKELSTFDASSDIRECWESYLPNLIYYTLKTESPTCVDFSSLSTYLQTQVNNVSGLTINIDPYDHDKNIRFSVDAILEFIEKNTGFMRFNHKSLADISKGVGFEARQGYTLAVPPFEYDTFYKNTRITNEVLVYLRKALEGDCQENASFGFRIPSSFVDALENYILSSTTLGTESTADFFFGDNNGLKFFTSGNSIAPNFSAVVDGGTNQEISVLDYWSSKSSNLYLVLPEASLNGTDKLTAFDIRGISDVLREYTPLHTLSRIYGGVDLSGDGYTPEEQNTDAGMCMVIKGQLQETNTVAMQNNIVSSWVGTHGTGGLAKLVNNPLPPTTTIENRYLPGTSGRNLLDEPALRGGTCRWNEQDPDGNYIVYDPIDINTDFPTAEEYPTLSEEQRKGVAIYEAVRRYGSFQSEFKTDDAPNSIKSFVSAGDGAGASGDVGLYASASLTLGENLGPNTRGNVIFMDPSRFTPGQRYRISFWYRAATGDKRDKSISFNIQQAEPFDSEDIETVTLVANNDSTLASGTAWHYKEQDFEYPSDGGSIGVSSTSSLNPSALVGPSVWFGAFAYRRAGGYTTAHSETSVLGIANVKVAPVFWEPAAGLERNSIRRRSYRYLLSGSNYNREGRSAPISNAFATSGRLDLIPTETGYLPQYLPKGFNFSGQNFISPAVNAMSGIYDASNTAFIDENVIRGNAPDANILGVPVNLSFPYRAIEELLDCSSSNEKRRQFTKSPKQIFIDYALRRGKDDYSFLDFSEHNMIYSEFGSGFHQLWLDYKDPSKFNLNLSGGGHDALAFAFGPLVFNNDFNTRGPAASATNLPGQDYEFSGLRAYRDGDRTALSSLQFANIAGSDGIVGESFEDPNGRLIAATLRGLIFSQGFGSYKSVFDTYEFGKETNIWANQSILSGIELVCKEGTNNLAVFNYKDFTDGCNPYLTSTALDKSITVFGGKEDVTDKSNALRVRFPLSKNFNLLANGDFKLEPTSARTLESSSLSAVSNWELLDPLRTPRFRSGALPSNYGWVTPSSVNFADYSGVPGTYEDVLVFFSKDNPPTLVGGNEKSMIATVNEGRQEEAVNSPLTLIPGENYKIELTASSLAATAGFGFVLGNVTKNVFYKPSDGTWGTETAFYRLAPAAGEITNKSYTVSKEFNVPVSANIDGNVSQNITFSPTDRWKLWIAPYSSANTGSYTLDMLFKATISKQQSNTLYPNRKYRAEVYVDYHDPEGLTDYLGIRLVTTPNPLVNGSAMKSFAYDWNGVGARWQLNSPGDLSKNMNISMQELPPFIDVLSGSVPQTKKIEFEFTTDNHRGPIDPETRQLMSISRGPEYGNIHTSDTSYTLEFIPLMPERQVISDANRPYIRLRNLNIVDVEYNESVKNLTTTEAKNFLEYFNTLRLTTATRDLAKGEELGLGTKGGARSEYLEPWGGPLESTIDYQVSGWTPYSI